MSSFDCTTYLRSSTCYLSIHASIRSLISHMFSVHTMQGTRNNPQEVYNAYLPNQLGLVVIGHIFPVLETQIGQAYINIVLDLKIEGIPAFTITRTRYLNLICKNHI